MSYTAPKGFYPWNRTNNPLLLKDDVGYYNFLITNKRKGKPSAYDLP